MSIALQVSPDTTVYHVLHCEVVPLTVAEGGVGYALKEAEVELLMMLPAEVVDGLAMTVLVFALFDPAVEDRVLVGAWEGVTVLVTFATYVPFTGPTL